MQKTLVAAIAAVMAIAPAHAGDLYGGSLKDAPVVQTYVPDWGGLYIGGSAGFGVGDTSGELVGIPLLQSKYDVNGAIYGAHIGYNWQRGDIVYGLEAGYNGSAIDGSSSCVLLLNCQRELDWYATGVARLGYASGSTLFYGFGGLAWGNVSTEIGFLSPAVPFLEGDESHFGWVAGVGLEHAFNDRFSVRVEYSHVDLGEEDTTLNFVGGGTLPVDDSVDLSFDAIKIGVSYKLTGGSSAPLK